MLELRHITKEYTIDKKAGSKVAALDDINLSLGDCGMVAVVGKSGSGKTTLLNIIGGIDKPTGGEALIDGKRLSDYKKNQLDDYRNFFVGFIFQDYNLLRDYSVIDNIKIAVRTQVGNEKTVSERAIDALKKTGISELADRKINTLSGGQQQRVAIARAIAKQTRLILCDEPTGNLDSKTSEEIINILKTISKERLVIIVTHDIDIASDFADRVIRLKDGKVAEDTVKAAPKRAPFSAKSETASSRGFSFRDTLIMIANNLWHSKVVSLTVLTLLTGVFALTIVFASLSAYDGQSALAETLKANGMYVVQLAKYVDEPREVYDYATGTTFIQHEPSIDFGKIKIEDLAGLRESVKGKADVYPSYFFNKNLQDFTDNFIGPAGIKFAYEAYGFTEAVAVDDFSGFHMEPAYGSLPDGPEEILIYDFMANAMLAHGVISGGINAAVGRVLSDRQTGLTVKISGVIKSNYLQYAYMKDVSPYESHKFEEAYLSSLQTVFCTPSLIPLLSAEADYEPIFEIFAYDERQEVADIIKTDIKKTKYVEVEGLSFLASVKNIDEDRGYVVGKKFVAGVLGIDEDGVTKEVAEE
ncbi:MAG: ABC transporter ATP-binding protein, partial [Clostridiales bacterium]|nr:ABC transporter ATP-binding protein [Clostridiales bacterium]